MSNSSSSSSSKVTSAQSTSDIDLFAAEPAAAPGALRAADDLLQLSNPFADAFAQPQTVVNPAPYNMPTNNIWMANGNGMYILYA